MNSLNSSIPSRPSNLSSIIDAILPSLFSFSKRSGTPTRALAPTPPSPPNTPHPLAFFTSGYMLGLLLLALVLHRIKHTVVPNPIHATRSPPHRTHPRSRPRRRSLRILPLDLTHTLTRLALHLPTLYLLSKALVLWLLIVLTAVPVSVAPPLVAWLAHHETQEVCWLTFCAICAAFCVEAFIRALDGRGLHGPLMGMGASESMNTSPFNLVGYAILLHSYASPVKHQSPSRPDKHAAIIITIPLLQLTLLHLLSISKRYSNHRLLPTALASLLSLAHFHTTLLSYLFAPKRVTPLAPTPTLPDPPPARPAQPAGIVHPSLPALNYIPNTFETLLILSIALSTALDRLARFLVHTDAAAFHTRPRRRQHSHTDPHHTSSHSLFEMDTDADTGSGRPGLFSRLPYDEDFGVVLLRAGLRSLEGGGSRGRGGGWRNEVGGVYLGVRERDVLSIEGRLDQQRPFGFANEVRMARTPALAHAQNTASPLGWAEDAFGARRVVARLRMWVRFFVAVGKGAVRGVKGVSRLVWGLVWVGKGAVRDAGRDESEEEVEEETVDEQEWREELLYQRFLRGDLSDDEDGADGDYSAADADEDEGSEEEEDAVEWDGRKEALRLLGELIFGAPREREEGRGEGGDGPGAVREEGRLVLARLFGGGQAPGGGVVTRRRWRGEDTHGPGLGSGEEARHVDGWIEGRRKAGVLRWEREGQEEREREERERERDRCVVCMMEGREVICWPCRCLAMCDACREALAAQSAASTHRCPCCRRGVEGFSRIYVP